jgi:hypothetical protein
MLVTRDAIMETIVAMFETRVTLFGDKGIIVEVAILEMQLACGGPMCIVLVVFKRECLLLHCFTCVILMHGMRKHMLFCEDLKMLRAW